MNSEKARKLVLRLAKKGRTALQIKKRVRSIHLSTIYTICKKAGVRLRSSRNKAPLAKLKVVMDLVASEGVQKAADNFGVTRQAIYDRIRRWKRDGLLA